MDNLKEEACALAKQILPVLENNECKIYHRYRNWLTALIEKRTPRIKFKHITTLEGLVKTHCTN